MICVCANVDHKFKPMKDCDHVFTTDPEILKTEFPTLYDLCKKGGKFRLQTKSTTVTEYYEAIDQFRARIEQKYGKKEQELLSQCQVLKSMLQPLFERAGHDNIVYIKEEIKRLHKQ